MFQCWEIKYQSLTDSKNLPMIPARAARTWLCCRLLSLCFTSALFPPQVLFGAISGGKMPGSITCGVGQHTTSCFPLFV